GRGTTANQRRHHASNNPIIRFGCQGPCAKNLGLLQTILAEAVAADAVHLGGQQFLQPPTQLLPARRIQLTLKDAVLDARSEVLEQGMHAGAATVVWNVITDYVEHPSISKGR